MEVMIVMGSQSDKEKMQGAAKALTNFKIDYRAYVLSAHRVPEMLEATLQEAEQQGTKIIIAGAGMAAHLPGVIASKTILPVIGVPLSASLQGMDALLAIVQMPKSIPVATVGIDNSYNAGLLAVQMLALGSPELKAKLNDFRKQMKSDFVLNNGQIEL